jgi:hypothetical protein
VLEFPRFPLIRKKKVIRNWYKDNNVKEKSASSVKLSESGGVTIQVRAVKPTHFCAQTIEYRQIVFERSAADSRQLRSEDHRNSQLGRTVRVVILRRALC